MKYGLLRKFRLITASFLVVFCATIISTMAHADFPKPVVTPAELKVLMDKKSVKVLDVRSLAQYSKGHIPGAIQIFHDSYNAPKPALDHTYPAQAQFEDIMGKHGITKDDYLILYDGAMNLHSARLWWIFDLYSHTNISLLNGGLVAWEAAGLPITTENTVATPTTYAATFDVSRLALAKDCVNTNDNTVLLDSRSSDEFSGAQVVKGAGTGGRIPKAVNIEWSAVIDKDSKELLPVEEIKTMYEDKGITPGKTIIAYCHSAVRGAYGAFIANRVLGIKDVKVYDGSWQEWSNDNSLPVEKSVF